MRRVLNHFSNSSSAINFLVFSPIASLMMTREVDDVDLLFMERFSNILAGESGIFSFKSSDELKAIETAINDEDDLLVVKMKMMMLMLMLIMTMMMMMI